MWICVSVWGRERTVSMTEVIKWHNISFSRCPIKHFCVCIFWLLIPLKYWIVFLRLKMFCLKLSIYTFMSLCFISLSLLSTLVFITVLIIIYYLLHSSLLGSIIPCTILEDIYFSKHKDAHRHTDIHTLIHSFWLTASSNFFSLYLLASPVYVFLTLQLIFMLMCFLDAFL